MIRVAVLVVPVLVVEVVDLIMTVILLILLIVMIGMTGKFLIIKSLNHLILVLSITYFNTRKPVQCGARLKSRGKSR